MKCEQKTITCDICGQDITYTYPVKTVYASGDKWDMPQREKYYRAKALYNHNLTHKGSIDILLTDKTINSKENIQ